MRSKSLLPLILVVSALVAAALPAQVPATALPAAAPATASSTAAPSADTPLLATAAETQVPALLCLAPASPAVAVQAAARPAGCPLYRACMEFVGGGCSCTGFYCNGRFICGTPLP
ncbi:MAG TPA: hypothetical protein VKY89_11950 [Thermoanaerobaculia bacterium]|nr:hypothetical protein [Thermoanaerobaculia bacterium]